MTEGLKALPTVYHGITFRSRTEARWAVMFDKLGLAWEHEREGFDVDGRWYLPDFYLPQFPLWLEVKPHQTDGSERVHFEKMCLLSGRSGIIAYGPPSAGNRNILFVDRADGVADGLYQLLADRRDEGVFWLQGDPKDGLHTFALGGPGNPTDHDRMPVVTDRLRAAFEASQAERFGT